MHSWLGLSMVLTVLLRIAMLCLANRTRTFHYLSSSSLDYQNILHAKIFIHVIPRCPPFSSWRTLVLPCGGTITWYPHRRQPECTDNSVQWCQYGFSASLLIWFGHPFCTKVRTCDKQESHVVKYFTCCAVKVHRQVILAVKLFVIHLELLHLLYVKEGGLKHLHYCEIL